MITIGKKIKYEEELKPVYIESVEASHVYMDGIKKKASGKVIQFKMKDKWVPLEEINTRKSVLTDSLFLRFINSSITRIKNGRTHDCHDFIVLRFKYGVNCRVDGSGEEIRISQHDLRTWFYINGVDYTFEKKNKDGEVVEQKKMHYKMLMRSPGKAKAGDCVFIREDLHHKAINFLTMGLYDLMDEESRNNPDKVFKIVEMAAYQTLTTAKAVGYIHIPLENILIVRDREVYSDGMRAAIVKDEEVTYTKKGEFQLDFSSPKLEELINRKGFTFFEEKALHDSTLKYVKKTKDALKGAGIRWNGKYPGTTPEIEYTSKECTVTMSENENIKNILWDGMGLIDEAEFPADMNGFIYCRSHFFKSCLFRGNVQQFFRDYCESSKGADRGIEYETYTLEDIDMFHRKIRLADVKVIITDKSIKWTKFVDLMGGTEERAYKFYRKWMKQHGNYFSIVKTAHKSKLGDVQLMTYQMNNSIPTTDEHVLRSISRGARELIDNLKSDDGKYLEYLEKSVVQTQSQEQFFNIDKVIFELVRWNRDFTKTEFFRDYKSKDISELKKSCCEGKIPQEGDNLTIMDNPIALLLTAVGDLDPLNEECFSVVPEGVQCYSTRFADGESLAAFRSPHNSPNNIIHLINVHPEPLKKYFPNIGENVIVFNAIKTDTQARLSGHDVDSDFVYVTNQKDLVDLAKKAYLEYPTIINEVKESGASCYHFTLVDFAKMDNSISDAQESIGTSTDIAQLALSYYYHDGMKSRELEECFIILSVLGQISIDLAKKSFDIDVVKEINRIRNLPCMKRNEIPKFFAENKKSRNNKIFDEKFVIKELNCPMDIMARQIDKETIQYAPRQLHILFRDILNKDIERNGNKYKMKRIITQARFYNNKEKWIEEHETELKSSTYFALKHRAMSQFLERVSKNLTQETIMQLVIYAFENEDVLRTILNFLYVEYREELFKCFVENNQKAW